MVSNEEISRRLMDRREGKSSNAYLVCNSCGGYYELKPGESPETFDCACDCGGQLIPSSSNTLFSYKEKDYSTEIFICYALFFFGGILAFLGGLYLLTRDDERARFHGKIIIGIFTGFLFIIFAIYAILIIRSY